MTHIVFGTKIKHVADEQRLKDAFSRQKKMKKPVFYVLPSMKWLQVARRKQPGLLITTFDDIASYILKQTNESYIPLSEQERSLFFQQFMREEEMFLTEKHLSGRAESYANTYGQVKRLGLTVEQLPKSLSPLLPLFQNYEEKIAKEKRLYDPEHLILQAIKCLNELGETIQITEVIIDGYYDFSSLQMLLIEALKEANIEVTIYVPNDTPFAIVDDTVRELTAIGFHDERNEIANRQNSVKKDLLEATTEEEQWRQIMEEIRLSPYPLNQTGILVADERLEEVERYCDLYKIPLNQAQKRSITTTSLYHFIVTFLKIKEIPSGKFEQLPFVEQVLKMYVVRGYTYAKQKQLFLHERKWLKEEWESLFHYGCSLIMRKNMKFVDYLQQLQSWLIELPLVSYWEKQIECEERLDYREELADELRAREDLIERLEKSIELLNERGLAQFTFSSDLFTEWFQQMANKMHLYKSRPLKTGISIYTWRDVGLFTGKKLYVVGMNEGVFPKPVHLSGYVQERDLYEGNIRFSPPTNERARLKQEAHFQQLDFITEDITYSYVIGTDPEGQLLPSSFIADLQLEKRICSTKERMQRTEVFFENDYNEKVAYHLGLGGNFAQVDERFSTKLERIKRLEQFEERVDIQAEQQKEFISVTQLESYANCPFRYAMERLMNVSSLQMEEEAISRLQLGQLIHELIEEVYTKHQLIGIPFGEVDKQTLEQIPETIHEIFEQKWSLVEREHQSLSRFELLVEKEKWKEQIDVWWDAECKHFWNNQALAEMKIEALEKQVSLPLELSDGKELRLIGKVDRIDTTETNFVIYDYKTGKASISFEEIRTGVKLQLPIYTIAVQKMMNEEKEADGASYISLQEPEKRASNGIWKPIHFDKTKYDLHSRANKEETLGTDAMLIKHHLHEKIEQLWNGMHSEFHVKPLNCYPSCDYRSVCRVTEEQIELSKGEKE